MLGVSGTSSALAMICGVSHEEETTFLMTTVLEKTQRPPQPTSDLLSVTLLSPVMNGGGWRRRRPGILPCPGATSPDPQCRYRIPPPRYPCRTPETDCYWRDENG
ncbi:hypothetical protein VUR80DRAFT_2889 [Thermomyces stellatus]